MADNLSQEEYLKKEFENNKNVEFYSHLVNGWITTTMEKDKALLTLSTAGLGVLVAFSDNVSSLNKISFSLYIAALICFIIAIISALNILSENADYCKSVINDIDIPDNEKWISILDTTLIWSFVVGLIFSIALSFFLITEKDNKNSETKIDNLETELKNLHYIQSLELKIAELKENITTSKMGNTENAKK